MFLNPFKAMETRNPPGVYFLRAAVLGTILDALARFNPLGHWINTMLDDFVVSVARASEVQRFELVSKSCNCVEHVHGVVACESCDSGTLIGGKCFLHKL